MECVGQDGIPDPQPEYGSLSISYEDPLSSLYRYILGMVILLIGMILIASPFFKNQLPV